MGAPPDGSLLYAASEKLHVYAVGDRGTLRAAPGSPHDLSVRALELAVHPSGRFVIVLGEGRGRRLIAVLRTGSDGSVSEVAGSPFELGADVRAMALAPDGASLFVTDADRHSIQTFGLDAGGGLHELASTPLDVPQAGYLTVDAQGRYVYASDMASGVVHGFAVDAAGALTPVPGSPFAVGPRAGSLVVSPRPEGPLQAAALPEADALAAQAQPTGADPATFRSASIDAVAAALKDPSDDARYFAIAALAGRTDVDSVMPAVIAALDDPHPPVRKMAGLIVGPWALAHPGQVDDAVLDKLVSGPTGRGARLDNASLTALHALKQRGPAAAPYLARGLINSGQLREEAEDALRDLGPAAAPAVPELRRLLQVNSEVRAHAANALGWIGPPAAEAVPDLYAMLDDPSPGAKRAAKWAIERIRGRH
jgi:HEAT repeat protein